MGKFLVCSTKFDPPQPHNRREGFILSPGQCSDRTSIPGPGPASRDPHQAQSHCGQEAGQGACSGGAGSALQTSAPLLQARMGSLSFPGFQFLPHQLGGQ